MHLHILIYKALKSIQSKPYLGDSGTNSVSLRPTWIIDLAPGQPGLRKEILS